MQDFVHQPYFMIFIPHIQVVDSQGSLKGTLERIRSSLVFR